MKNPSDSSPETNPTGETRTHAKRTYTQLQLHQSNTVKLHPWPHVSFTTVGLLENHHERPLKFEFIGKDLVSPATFEVCSRFTVKASIDALDRALCRIVRSNPVPQRCSSACKAMIQHQAICASGVSGSSTKTDIFSLWFIYLGARVSK
uniref:Uncharacterized protein LOC104227424 n=1 Tax=Nicotiana sylvestris TaxID=4096 RepID=A0A1U7WL12_NICSY|nr:PREDICTED: uncharacterized protein LOC104227424 [Nicotiana sylvestris]